MTPDTRPQEPPKPAIRPPILTESTPAARDEELITRMGASLSNELSALALFLVDLAELDRRKLGLERGYASTFAFLTKHFKLAEATAWRRITVARMIAQFPVIVDRLRSGRIHIKALCTLRGVLEESNVVELLDRADRMSDFELKRLVATLRPRPAPGDLVRRLPPRQPSAPKVDPAAAVTPAVSGEPIDPGWPNVQQTFTQGGPNAQPSSAQGGPPSNNMAAMAAAHGALLEPTRPRERLTPINAEQSVFRMTVGPAYLELYGKVKSALSHKIPSGRAEDVLTEALRIALEVLEKRRLGSPARAQRSRKEGSAVVESAPASTEGGATAGDEPSMTNKPSRRARATDAVTRHIPKQDARAVWERDGGQCAFVGVDGRRCGSTHLLQFQHDVPWAKGGSSRQENLLVYCAAHNQLMAERDFGREDVEARRAVARAMRGGSGEECTTGMGKQAPVAKPDPTGKARDGT